MKKDEKKIKKLLEESKSSFVDKLASLKYVTKKDSTLISSVISNTLKKEEIVIFLLQKNSIPGANHYLCPS